MLIPGSNERENINYLTGLLIFCRIEKKLLRGRDFVKNRISALDNVRRSEQSLRKRIATTVKRREAFKDVDR